MGAAYAGAVLKVSLAVERLLGDRLRHEGHGPPRK
jgi:hypothetical protein